MQSPHVLGRDQERRRLQRVVEALTELEVRGERVKPPRSAAIVYPFRAQAALLGLVLPALDAFDLAPAVGMWGGQDAHAAMAQSEEANHGAEELNAELAEVSAQVRHKAPELPTAFCTCWSGFACDAAWESGTPLVTGRKSTAC